MAAIVPIGTIPAGGSNAVKAAPPSTPAGGTCSTPRFRELQRALPACVVSVTALDAWLVDYCWHGRVSSSLVRRAPQKGPIAHFRCAGPPLLNTVDWREFIPPSVFKSWETLLASWFPPWANIVEAIAEGRVTRNLPGLPVSRRSSYRRANRAVYRRRPVVVCALTGGTRAGSAGFSH